ncbi:MAG: glycosyltransferase [Acidobacteriota bacterium]|nr:glycosyltransferase [Blastocatellia bacterium]MDW8239997.1 glycosyltransferase [Acidobacteriota bacterium]
MTDVETAGQPPTITVVIPAYNEEKYIGATIENVKAAIREYHRVYPDEVEILVVNNNSTDRTEEVARAHGARVVFEGKNQIAASRNAGGRAARGRIVAFLDADDHISPNMLILVHQAMMSGEYIGGGVARIYRDKPIKMAEWLEKINNLGRRITGVSTGLIYTTKEAFQQVGGYDERYYAAEEGRFILDLKKLGKQQGKKFRNITEGYVIKSARKFEKLTPLELIWTGLKFVLFPWKLKDRKECSFWYDQVDQKK